LHETLHTTRGKEERQGVFKENGKGNFRERKGGGTRTNTIKQHTTKKKKNIICFWGDDDGGSLRGLGREATDEGRVRDLPYIRKTCNRPMGDGEER